MTKRQRKLGPRLNTSHYLHRTHIFRPAHRHIYTFKLATHGHPSSSLCHVTPPSSSLLLLLLSAHSSPPHWTCDEKALSSLFRCRSHPPSCEEPCQLHPLLSLLLPLPLHFYTWSGCCVGYAAERETDDVAVSLSEDTRDEVCACFFVRSCESLCVRCSHSPFWCVCLCAFFIFLSFPGGSFWC